MEKAGKIVFFKTEDWCDDLDDDNIDEMYNEILEQYKNNLGEEEKKFNDSDIEKIVISNENDKDKKNDFNDCVKMEKFEKEIEGMPEVTRSIINEVKSCYCELKEAQKEESMKEPKKENINWKQQFYYLEEWSPSEQDKNYVDKPHFLSKLNYPFRKLKEDTIKMIIGEEYPEKWGKKMRIDLFDARNFIKRVIKENEVLEVCDQDAVLNYHNYLKSFSTFSHEYKTYWEFGMKLEETEREGISKTLLGKSKIKSENSDISEDTGKSFWMLSLIDGINYKVKLSHSMMKSNKQKNSSMEFRENKRINVKANKAGSSEITVELKESRSNRTIISEIFLSSNINIITYDRKMLICHGDALSYLTTVIDNIVNLNLIRDCSEVKEEKELISYILRLMNYNTKVRVGMASLYESTCLLMGDFKHKSSRLPILDNILDSLEVSKELTESLLEILKRSSTETAIKMSCIGKTLVYAEVNERKGLEKYTQRTNRNHEISKDRIEKLRLIFRMKCITTYIKKYGRVPTLKECPDLLMTQFEIMAGKGQYDKSLLNNPIAYKNVKMGKMLEAGQESNLSSRVIDKACSKDNYDEISNGVKELMYYISKEDFDDLEKEINIDRKERSLERKVKVLDRCDEMLSKIPKYMMVRLIEKEKELKEAARFYGVASFYLKVYISTTMELIKRAMKLLPGQMMTMSEDERRTIMSDMSRLLEEEDSYSIFLDYSGHNTSQRPENNMFILEEIADMYGYEENSRERNSLINVSYVFSNIKVIFENNWSDSVYFSEHQNGAIEGWLGPLWGIQSQLMMEDMLSLLGFKKYIGTTYSDDSCGVFHEENLTSEKLDNIIRFIQNYGYSMGLLVKLSQTQVTNGRCSMLKNHYFKQELIENNYKRMMGISQYSATMWGDTVEMLSAIDSGFTSSVVRASDNKLSVWIRNFKVMTIMSDEIKRFVEHCEIELDPRYYYTDSDNAIIAKRKMKELEERGEEAIIKPEIILPSGLRDITRFYMFNKENKEMLNSILALFYLPMNCFGLSLTNACDSLISGYSLSNIKRISFVGQFLSDNMKRTVSEFVAFSSNAHAYISNPFPLVGGRFDTSTLMHDALKTTIMKFVKNKEIIRINNLAKDLDENLFKNELVTIFRKSFHSRIVSKFYETSIFAFTEELLSKVDNSSTFSILVGKKRMSQLWNKAWSKNHNLSFKQGKYDTRNNNSEVRDYRSDMTMFSDFIEKRNNTDKFLDINGEKIKIELNFIDIDEIPLLGKVSKKSEIKEILPIFRSNKMLGNLGIIKREPTKTHINKEKFDRDIEIEGMFQNKLIFNAYEITRYTKWLIMELTKFSELSEETEKSLIKCCNLTLDTFTEARFDEIVEHVVSPRGGRYFHRANAAGFNQKTGDLSNNLKTRQYELAGIEELISNTGGDDNNLNIQYLIISLRVSLSYIDAKNEDITALSIDEDVKCKIREVSFSLSELKREGLIHYINYGKHYVNGKKAIREKSKLYKNYSSYISMEEHSEKHFINQAIIIPLEIQVKESHFRTVYMYMEDQMILSPVQIPLNILEELIPNFKNEFNGKEMFFDEFYRYFTSLNMIGNETPTRSIIRSMLFKEIWKKNENGKEWIIEMEENGYSEQYKTVMLRIFVVCTSLCYKLERIDTERQIMLINEPLTINNAISNFKRLKRGKVHLNTKDKRISSLLVNGLPLLSYSIGEIRKVSREIVEEFDKTEFSQLQINEYFTKEYHRYIDLDSGKNNVSNTVYESFKIDSTEFDNKIGLIAAIKGFELLCSLNSRASSYASPTRSDIYSSMKPLIRKLKMEDKIIEPILDLFGGRGDTHLVLTEEELDHKSISRNDGYNLIMRMPGMIEKKGGWDATKQENYMNYMEHETIILDVSYFTGKTKNFNYMLRNMLSIGKIILLRLNTTLKMIDNESVKMIELCDSEIFLPNIQSAGVIFLRIDSRGKFKIIKNKTYEEKKNVNDECEGKSETREGIWKGKEGRKEDEVEKEREKASKEKKKRLRVKGKKFGTSLLLEKLTNELVKARSCKLIQDSYEEIDDHTVEAISDEELSELLISKSDAELLQKFDDDESGLMLEEKILFTPLPQGMSKLTHEFIDLLVIENKVNIYKPKMVRNNTNGIKTIKELKRFYREKTNQENKEIEVTSYMKSAYTNGFIVDFNFMSKDELMRLKDIIIRNTLLFQSEIKFWKTMTETISDRKVYNMRDIKETEELKEFDKLPKSITRIKNIARKAIFYYRRSKVTEGLLIISGFNTLKMRELMKNKTKKTKNNIIDYKLLINRIRRLRIENKLNYVFKNETVKDVESEKEKIRMAGDFISCDDDIMLNGDEGNLLIEAIVKAVRENDEEEEVRVKVEKEDVQLLTCDLLGMSEMNRKLNEDFKNNINYMMERGEINEDDFIDDCEYDE